MNVYVLGSICELKAEVSIEMLQVHLLIQVWFSIEVCGIGITCILSADSLQCPSISMLDDTSAKVQNESSFKFCRKV